MLYWISTVDGRYLRGLVPLEVLQGLVQVAVGPRALALPHVEHSVHEGVEALLGRHAAAAERQVLRHPGRTPGTYAFIKRIPG